MSQLQIPVQHQTTVVPPVSGQASVHVTTTDTSPISKYSGSSCERPGWWPCHNYRYQSNIKLQWSLLWATRLVAMSQLQIPVQHQTIVVPPVSGQAGGHVTTTDTSPTSNYSGPSCERPGWWPCHNYRYQSNIKLQWYLLWAAANFLRWSEIEWSGDCVWY